MSASAAFDQTQRNQRDASDPRSSAWVIANAGSGKTHVLTQRVIRLMLDGVDPATILCLTFTRIAAAEMARRVFGTLGKWTMLGEGELAAAIEELGGRKPDAEEIRRARQLFARALETPGGLKIQTIHAFCERLLHEFPFEANVPGRFTVLDDSAAAALIASARADVLNEAAAEPESDLGHAVRHMAERANDEQIGQALDALINKRDAIRRWMEQAAGEGEEGKIDDALADLASRLGLADGKSEEAICRLVCRTANWDRERCGELVSALLGSENQSDRGARTALQAVAGAGSHALEADGRIEFFLSFDTDAGGWRCRSASRRFGSAFRKDTPGLDQAFDDEASRLLGLAGRLLVARTYDATAALLTVGDAILRAYQDAKRRAGALDFSDLIAKTRSLLSRADAAQWVFYKLDRRVEHILVDEAQDTSPDQWRVVKAIAEDFFSGEGAARAPRTIFAVGDDKQSIFGFQGADPRMLVEMQRYFQQRIEEAKQGFVARPLFLSFRSTREVLNAVDTVFGRELAEKITASTYETHSSNRDHVPGHVVLLPRTVRQKREEPDDWTAPYEAPTAAETDLAVRIADEIDQLRGTVLPSGKRVKDGEILILVRKRDAFAAAMNRALRARRIPTAGADRIPVSTHITVLDLLALADVILLPEDDLQLAACLKSPLLGLGEEELMQLAVGRHGASLWRTLLARTDQPYAEIAGKLQRWRAMADRMTPFRLFAEVLGPDGGRRAFRARLGGEADDVLDAFLSQALAYEGIEAPSLQGFARFIRANEGDIKREAQEGASGVRIMTVHGAKGLEADVVFLVDTGGKPVVPGQRDILVAIGKSRDDPAFLWRRIKEEAVEEQRHAEQIADADTEREYLRLLYVAMTRARDVLYLAGVRLLQVPDFTWYTLVQDALAAGATTELDENGELREPFRWPQPVRPPLAETAAPADAVSPATAAPDWLHRTAAPPPSPPQPLRPSEGLGDPDTAPARPPIRRPDEDALIRGRAVHRLLQHLPALPGDARDAAAERLLAGEIARDADLAALARAEAEAALSHPELATTFAGESRAEVAIVGNVLTAAGNYSVSGRIDRLQRGASGWRLVDFKTDRSVPASVAEVDPAYVLQLALYRRLLMDMEPGVPVAATLVYTAAPKIVPIPAESMEKALEALGVRANPVP